MSVDKSKGVGKDSVLKDEKVGGSVILVVFFLV